MRAPTDMVMIARVSILLRGVANAFNVRLKVAKQWWGVTQVELVRPMSLKGGRFQKS